jgi:hypothetical protein
VHWGRIVFIVVIIASVLWAVIYAGVLYVRTRIEDTRNRHTGQRGPHYTGDQLNPESQGSRNLIEPLMAQV